MSKKGKHGVRNPKRTKPNPYAKRRNRGGWGNEPREDEWRNERWTRNAEQEPEDNWDSGEEDKEEYDGV